MTISLLVAMTPDFAIGKDNKLLWHLPNDLRYFKNLTWAGVVVMGRKTFESVGKPLPGRVNIVVTRQKDWSAKGTQTAIDVEDALAQAKRTNCKEIFIIGGGEIYQQTLTIADKMYITKVITKLKGDTFFPVFNENEWKLEEEIKFSKDAKHKYDYSFQTWIRK